MNDPPDCTVTVEGENVVAVFGKKVPPVCTVTFVTVAPKVPLWTYVPFVIPRSVIALTVPLLVRLTFENVYEPVVGGVKMPPVATMKEGRELPDVVKVPVDGSASVVAFGTLYLEPFSTETVSNVRLVDAVCEVSACVPDPLLPSTVRFPLGNASSLSSVTIVPDAPRSAVPLPAPPSACVAPVQVRLL